MMFQSKQVQFESEWSSLKFWIQLWKSTTSVMSFCLYFWLRHYGVRWSQTWISEFLVSWWSEASFCIQIGGEEVDQRQIWMKKKVPNGFLRALSYFEAIFCKSRGHLVPFCNFNTVVSTLTSSPTIWMKLSRILKSNTENNWDPWTLL
jgi:hypothetical protein